MLAYDRGTVGTSVCIVLEKGYKTIYIIASDRALMASTTRVMYIHTNQSTVMNIAVVRNIALYSDVAVIYVNVSGSVHTAHKLLVSFVCIGVDADQCGVSSSVLDSSVSEAYSSTNAKHRGVNC